MFFARFPNNKLLKIETVINKLKAKFGSVRKLKNVFYFDFSNIDNF